MNRGIAVLVLSAHLFGSSAAALADDQPSQVTLLSAPFVAVPDEEADRIAPMTPELWHEYHVSMQEQALKSMSYSYMDFGLGIGQIDVGLVLVDVLVNLGKAAWKMIEAGRAKIDLNMDVASAVPKGISNWADLDRWEDPATKLYRTQLLTMQGRSLGDIYYRLIFTYGGNYKGHGHYLTNVAVVPAQIKVPYHKDFYASTQVTDIVNHGTHQDPIAGMTLLLEWGLSSLTGKTVQSVSLHVRGDGHAMVLPSAGEQPETVRAPVHRATPTPAPTQKPTPTPTPTPRPSASASPAPIHWPVPTPGHI